MKNIGSLKLIVGVKMTWTKYTFEHFQWGPVRISTRGRPSAKDPTISFVNFENLKLLSICMAKQQLIVTAPFRDLEMGKKSNLLISLEEYAEASTVHGVGYVFSRTQIYFTAFSHQSIASCIVRWSWSGKSFMKTKLPLLTLTSWVKVTNPFEL